MLKVEIKPMSNIVKHNRKYVCNCPTLCERFINIEDYGNFCEGQAIEFSYNLIALLKGGVAKVPDTERQRGWTTAEIQFIKNWYDSGFKRGDRKLIAKSLNRSISSVASRIDYMKKVGML